MPLAGKPTAAPPLSPRCRPWLACAVLQAKTGPCRSGGASRAVLSHQRLSLQRLPWGTYSRGRGQRPVTGIPPHSTAPGGLVARTWHSASRRRTRHRHTTHVRTSSTPFSASSTLQSHSTWAAPADHHTSQHDVCSVGRTRLRLPRRALRAPIPFFPDLKVRKRGNSLALDVGAPHIPPGWRAVRRSGAPTAHRIWRASLRLGASAS